MVCVHGKLPLLQLGDHDVAGYGDRWLQDAIEEAGTGTGFAHEIAAAVLYYLGEVYEENTITLPEVESQLRSCLEAIGRHETAEQVHLHPPRQHLALTELAYRAGPGFDLAFFNLLASRLRLARASGTREVTCSGLAESISILLRGTPQHLLRQRAGKLAEELIGFIRAGVGNTAGGRRIRLTIG